MIPEVHIAESITDVSYSVESIHGEHVKLQASNLKDILWAALIRSHVARNNSFARLVNSDATLPAGQI